MNPLRFDKDELQLVKLTFEHPDLRQMFISLKLSRFLRDDISDMINKIFSIPYFIETKIDIAYVSEKAENHGIESLYFSMLREDLDKIESSSRDFWILVDAIKCKSTKTRVIPVLLNEYEAILRSSSEFELISSLSKISDSITEASGKGSMLAKTEGELRDIRERLKIYTGAEKSDQKRYLTGYRSLDGATNGFASSEFNVFMGASGSGKTTVLLNVAYQLWETSGANVMFFTFEMPYTQVLRRLDSRIFEIDYAQLKVNEIKGLEETAISRIASKPNMFKIIDLPPRTGVRKIEECVLSSVVRPDVVVVDYIGLIGGDSRRNEQRWETLDEAAISLKTLAKKYHISVITASQINSEAMKRKEVKTEGYALYDLAGAKAIGDHADLVLGVQYEEALKMMSFNCPKYRDGGKMNLNFQMFVNLERCHIFEIQKAERA